MWLNNNKPPPESPFIGVVQIINHYKPSKMGWFMALFCSHYIVFHSPKWVTPTFRPVTAIDTSEEVTRATAPCAGQLRKFVAASDRKLPPDLSTSGDTKQTFVNNNVKCGKNISY